MTFAVVTTLLFNIRFFLLLSRPEEPLAGIWKVLSHLDDTMLLFIEFWLMKVTHFTSFDSANWLGIRILLLLVYIGLGVVVMKARPCSLKSFITCLLVMACVGSIMYPVMYKPF